ncbi:hypothetical protein HDU76_011843, partial [Blyttiomyces sp. JEL0837]
DEDDEYALMDKDGQKVYGNNNDFEALSWPVLKHPNIRFHLIHIPMRHCWMDEIDSFIIDSSPDLLADFSLAHGHLQLYQKLVQQNGGTPWRQPAFERCYLIEAAVHQPFEEFYKDLVAAGYHTPSISQELAIGYPSSLLQSSLLFGQQQIFREYSNGKTHENYGRR